MTTATLGIAVTSNADKAAVDLEKLAGAAGRAEVGVTQLAGASVKTAAATQQMSLNSANIAAQLQDVVVSAQMGMGALQVGLQQGTQLSAEINRLRANGVGTGAALAAAFTSVVNPVSLITIGLIAASTVGIQALGGLVGGAEDATDALEKHHDELSRVVTGYDEAESAVKDFIAETERLPRGAVQIELGAEFEKMQEQVQDFRDRALQLGPALAGSLNETDREVSGLLTRFNQGQMSAEDLAVELTRLANTDFGPLGFGLADMVNQLLAGATQAAALEGSLVGISHALAGTAVNGGLQMALDSRIESERSATAHQIELDALKAVTPAQMAEIARRRERLKLVDEEISEALREQKIREAGEVAFARANARSGKSATKDMDRWGNTVEDFQKRIDQMQAEIDLFGKGTEELVRQKEAINLLNEAKQAGIPITDEVTEQIGRMSGELATATADLERLQYQQGRIDELNNTLASGFANLFVGIADGSKSAQESIGDLLSSLGNLLINQAFQSLFAPTSVGGGGFNPFGFLFGGGRANGGPVQAGHVYAVNENTPNTEYFAPAVNGSIVTAEQMKAASAAGGSGAPVVHVAIDARGAQIGVAEQIDHWARIKLPGLVQRAVNDPYAVGA